MTTKRTNWRQVIPIGGIILSLLGGVGWIVETWAEELRNDRTRFSEWRKANSIEHNSMKERIVITETRMESMKESMERMDDFIKWSYRRAGVEPSRVETGGRK